MKILQLTREELQRVQVVGCHLHSWQGKDKNDIKRIFQEQGMVQLDPLNPAGRNHDIFFFSRISEYEQGDFEKTIYPGKSVFEYYFPNLFAISVEFFPLFYSRMGEEHIGRYYESRLKKLKELDVGLLDKVLKHIKDKGPTRSTDLAELGKAYPEYALWKTGRNSGVAMELLWAMGKLAVKRDYPNFRKVYDLIENQIHGRYLVKKKYIDEELQYMRLKLKLRSYPVIDIGRISITKQGKIKSAKKIVFPLDKLVQSSEIGNNYEPILVQVENDSTGYIIPSNWKKLREEELDSEMRAIAPLDPLTWDRKLLKKLFDFDYAWEVYKKAQDRVWGYYVYPLLYKGCFVGRFEVKFDKKSKILKVFNFQSEKEMDAEKETGMIDLLSRWKQMIGANEIQLDSSITFKE
ncbi:MAG: DNA glycosylase AlkZ-like family protein [Candidatus Hodarchaeales archaeon]|jgi:uncharacterized protein YcaQ